MKVHRVNGVQVADLVGAGLVTKERAVLPLKVTVPFYAARWVVRQLLRLVRLLVRVWPVSVPVLAGLALWLRFGWLGPVGLVAGLVAVAWVWRESSPVTFDAWVIRRGRGALRGVRLYRRLWWAAMDGTGLSRQTASAVYVPKVTRITSTRWVDTVSVRLLHGQTPADLQDQAEGLRHVFGAYRATVREIAPGRVEVRFYARDPLTAPVLPLAADPVVNLAALPVGRTEEGMTYRLSLYGTHLLIAGATGAGKSSPVWSICSALVPGIRAGLVTVTGLDPKGGMELYPARDLFTHYADESGEQMVTCLEAAVDRMLARRDRLKAEGKRVFVPSPGDPFEVIVIDELAFLTAYLTDKGLRERVKAALSLLLSQGRAPGFAVVAALQDPRKEVLSFRNLFPTRIALRLAEDSEVDMVLGDGALDNGARCHEIPHTLPGVGYVRLDGVPEPTRVRFCWFTDPDVTAMAAQLTRPAAPQSPALGIDLREPITIQVTGPTPRQIVRPRQRT
ncbi:MAG TPA: FtsK/SpoIIIE domain-containing protein, partial [Kineosporiaceae bacterium]|nr:FtsK/SpoIIIE domain-containing protein [Kineosporiaceae bacterium]